MQDLSSCHDLCTLALHALEMLPPGQELGVFQGLLASGDKPWCFCRGGSLLLSSSHPLPVVFVLDHFFSSSFTWRNSRTAKIRVTVLFQGREAGNSPGRGPQGCWKYSPSVCMRVCICKYLLSCTCKIVHFTVCKMYL